MAATPRYLFRSLLLAAGLLLSTQVFAADSDGDGIPDLNSRESFGVSAGPLPTDWSSPQWNSYVFYTSGGVGIQGPNAYLEAVLTTGTTISFLYRQQALNVGNNCLAFRVDGQLIATLSPDATAWKQYSTSVSAGVHTLRWANLCMNSFGQNKVFAIDDVEYGMADNCPLASNADQLNTDGDAQGNACDTDDDNDGVVDTADAYPLDNTQAADMDGDGIEGLVDNCPTISNPTQLDTDGDAQGDACDSTPTGDTDGDSVDNAIDNCLMVANNDQLDANTSGIGDACEITAENPLRNARAGSAVAFGDFDNDGFDDVVVGIPLFDVVNGAVIFKDAGRVDVYSGATGELLNGFNGTTAGQQFGSAIAVVADQNSDGIPDLIVGEPLFDVPATKPLKDAGRVALYSGSDGVLLQQIAVGSAAGDHFGAAVAVGNGNLVVGSPWADLPLLKDAGYVTVFNGLTSDILYVRSGTQTKQFFGASLAFDEINNHLFIGSPGFDVLLPTKLTDVGQVDIFDGSTGATAALFSVNGSTKGNRFGSSITSFNTDIGGSADLDWAAGSPGADVVDPVTLKPRKDIGMVQVFSGLSATVQVQIDGEKAGDNFGAAISASGDINNDNTPDIAIGAPGYDASGATTLKDAGTVEVFSGDAIY